PDGVQCISDRKLFELLVDARAPAQAGRVMKTKNVFVPTDIDRNRVARDASLGTGEQPLLAEKTIDQRRLASIRPADDSNADRSCSCALALVNVYGLIFRRRSGQIRKRHA